MNIVRNAVVFVAALLLPITTFASSISLTPGSITPTKGQTFTVTLTADPAGAKAYTVRANVSFDPALVQFVSFAFAPKWMALSQAGYDTEDNTTGVLAKTAGYPGGIASPTLLGTATFRAVAAGTSSIRATTNSLMLNSAGANQVSGTQGSTQVTVAAAVSQPATKPVVKPAPTTTTKPVAKPSPTVTAPTTTAPAATSTALVAPTTLAAVAATTGFSFGPLWAWIIALIIIIAGGILWYRSRNY